MKKISSYLKSFLFVGLICFFGSVPCLQAAQNMLRLALLPIPDAMPAHVAQELGLFEKHGVKVEILSVGSGMERDQLMQAGRIDGMVNELMSTASFNRKESQVFVVATARKPVGDVPLFRLLVSPKEDVSLGELKDGSIVISKNTVIDYVTEKMLVASGQGVLKGRSVPSLPERYQLLLSGQVVAATLPEPLATSAMAAGAKELVNDTVVADESMSVLSISREAIENTPEAVQALVTAWMEAAELINADPLAYQDIMRQKIRVPGNIRKTYTLPPYPVNNLPSEEQWQTNTDWMQARGLLQESLPYRGSVTSQFLPNTEL